MKKENHDWRIVWRRRRWIIQHELGHAMIASLLGYDVLSIRLYPPCCRYMRPRRIRSKRQAEHVIMVTMGGYLANAWRGKCSRMYACLRGGQGDAEIIEKLAKRWQIDVARQYELEQEVTNLLRQVGYAAFDQRVDALLANAMGPGLTRHA